MFFLCKGIAKRYRRFGGSWSTIEYLPLLRVQTRHSSGRGSGIITLPMRKGLTDTPLKLVTLPYNLLLQKSAREALGIKLKDQIVIIDEAHSTYSHYIYFLYVLENSQISSLHCSPSQRSNLHITLYYYRSSRFASMSLDSKHACLLSTCSI